MGPTCPSWLWTGALSLGVLAGCASTRLDAQWADPQRGASPLHGARVMVACEAYDDVLARLCLDRLNDEIVARGATPVPAPATANPAPGRPLGPEQYLAAARRAGARAVFTTYVTPAASSVSQGMSIGLGGFGVGGGGFGAGGGVTVPVGGGRLSIGYSASSRVTDTASGRLLWTAKATSPPSGDVGRQLSELTKAVFSAADKAELF
jgi:hypothetical protein